MIALIDFDSALYIAAADKADKDSYTGDKIVIEKTEDLAIEQIHNILNETTKAVGADSYIIFLTSGKNFRYNIDPAYKANRIGTEPPKLLKFCKDYVRSLPGVMDCTTIEADDAVVVCRNYFKSEGAVNRSIICSPDKDIIKCVSGTHYNYRTLEFIETNLADAEYNFWSSVICGDSSDGIKGIPGKGPTFAKKLFESNTNVLYRTLVQQAYVDHYKSERTGLMEFTKNYLLLKMLEEPDYDFVIPEPYVIPANPVTANLF